MTHLKDIVNKWAESYQAKKEALPEIGVLEDELYSASGITKDEPHSLLLIPVDSLDIKYAGSACGRTGNKVFLDDQICNYLKEEDVNEILAIIYDPDDASTYRSGAIGLNSVALPLERRKGRKFESLVEARNGSFRQEDSKVPGWSVFESE